MCCVFVLTSGEELTDLAQGLHGVACMCGSTCRQGAAPNIPPPNLDGRALGMFTAGWAA